MQFIQTYIINRLLFNVGHDFKLIKIQMDDSTSFQEFCIVQTLWFIRIACPYYLIHANILYYFLTKKMSHQKKRKWNEKTAPMTAAKVCDNDLISNSLLFSAFVAYTLIHYTLCGDLALKCSYVFVYVKRWFAALNMNLNKKIVLLSIFQFRKIPKEEIFSQKRNNLVHFNIILKVFCFISIQLSLRKFTVSYVSQSSINWINEIGCLSVILWAVILFSFSCQKLCINLRNSKIIKMRDAVSNWIQNEWITLRWNVLHSDDFLTQKEQKKNRKNNNANSE